MKNIQSANFEVCGLSDIGKMRSQNEDSGNIYETLNGLLCIVCDGMGGSVGGAAASKLAVQSIADYFSRSEHGNIVLAIDRAIRIANKNIYQKAIELPDLKGMGTTCVVLLFQEEKNTVYIGYVGDSRIYIRSEIDGKPKLYRLTKDHSVVQNLIDRGIITEIDADTHPQRNEISKALGVFENVEPTIVDKPIYPAQGDVFLLCSDGLCGFVNDMTMQQIINRPNFTLNQKCQELVNIANNAGGKDNITVQLLEIRRSRYGTSVFEDKSPKNNVVTGSYGNYKNISNKYQNSTLSAMKKFWYVPLLLIVLIVGTALILTHFDVLSEGVIDKYKNLTEQERKKENISTKDEGKTNGETKKGVEKTEEDDNLNKTKKDEETNISTVDINKKDPYTYHQIQEGDNWSKLWKKYKVCSCFIKNLEKNKSSLENGDLILGKTLSIPWNKSGFQEYNPNGYQEYTQAKIGKACKNVCK